MGLFSRKDWNVIAVIFERADLFTVSGQRVKGGSADKARDGAKAHPRTIYWAVFDQKGCRFLPHVVVVRVGQKMLIKSGDPIAHNTHTFPSRNDVFNSTIAASVCCIRLPPAARWMVASSA